MLYSYLRKEKNDFTTMNYSANNDEIGFVNTIYITYTNGNVCN